MDHQLSSVADHVQHFGFRHSLIFLMLELVLELKRFYSLIDVPRPQHDLIELVLARSKLFDVILETTRPELKRFYLSIDVPRFQTDSIAVVEDRSNPLSAIDVMTLLEHSIELVVEARSKSLAAIVVMTLSELKRFYSSIDVPRLLHDLIEVVEARLKTFAVIDVKTLQEHSVELVVEARLKSPAAIVVMTLPELKRFYSSIDVPRFEHDCIEVVEARSETFVVIDVKTLQEYSMESAHWNSPRWRVLFYVVHTS